jgi:hypothetical protein
MRGERVQPRGWSTRQKGVHALRVVVLTVALAVLAAGCGDEVRTTSGSAPFPSTPVRDGTVPLVRVEHVGGFLPVGAAFAQVPQLTVYPDGRAITQGPQILIFPGPALPNLLVHELSAAQLEAIEGLAADAGLLSEPPDYGTPPVADAPTTVVTLTFGGSTVVHHAQALGIGEDPRGEAPGLDAEAVAAREALSGFIEEASSLVTAADDGTPYQPEAFAVLARPVAADGPPPEPGLEPDVIAWPLPEVDLASAEQCVVVDGPAAGTLRTTFEDATQLTRFRQDEQDYEVYVRLLLPGEEDCPEPGPVGP